MNTFLFSEIKVPIAQSVEDTSAMLLQHPHHFFCLYLAYKDDAAWDISTSRVYMNQVFSNLIYLPVNIRKEDYDSLRKIYALSEKSQQIIAINQTQPHKSNPVLKELFTGQEDIPVNIDALIKDSSGKLIPYDLNGPSFCDWFVEEVEQFTDKTVILVGVGGVGEPIARKIADDNPHILYLVNPSNRDALKEELSAKGTIAYMPDVHLLFDDVKNQNLILINAAGKEGATDDSGVLELLELYQQKNFVFVDLRPQIDIDIVKKANELGWKGYTGYGMNARNDYTLLKKIAEIIDNTILTFEEFKALVKKAS